MKKILILMVILSMMLPTLCFAGRADNDFWRGSEIEAYAERGQDEDGPNYKIGMKWKWRFVPKGKDRADDCSNDNDRYEEWLEDLDERVEDLENEVY